jgi:hypothetical protein
MEYEFGKNETVDTLDTVPEQFRGIYAEDPADKKFKINPVLKGIATAIDGLNGALRNERKSTTALKGQKDVAAVVKEVFGLDTVEEVKAKMEELNLQVAEKSKVDPAKIRAEIERTFNAERDTLKASNAKMQLTLDRYLIDSAGTTALAEMKGNIKLLMPIVKAQAVVVADGEDYVVRIKDPAGDYRGNGAGGFMTVADLVKELKASADYGVAFQSEAPSGGGRQSSRTQPASQQRQTATGSNTDNTKTPAEMIAAGLAARRAAR